MRLALALLFAWLLPGAASAVEVVLGVTGETAYNTNVFGLSENSEADGNVQGGPILRLRDRTGQLTWEVSYEPSYQKFFRLSDIDDFYQLANGRLSWRPSARTEFYGENAFSITPVRDTSFQTGQPAALVQPIPIFSNVNVLQNFADIGARYSFSPRWLGEISFSNSLVDYEDVRFTDSLSTNGQVFAVYQLRPADRIGAGIGATLQRFSSQLIDTPGSNFYQLFGIWNHDFSPTMSLKINAGPTLVQPQTRSLTSSFPGTPVFANPIPRADGSQNVIQAQFVPPFSATVAGTCGAVQGVPVAEACAVYPFSTAAAGLDRTFTARQIGSSPDSGGNSITYFANVSLEKRWTWFTGRISYVRSASTTSGLGQSTVTDTLRAYGAWTPSRLWSFTLTGIYTQQDTAGDRTQVLTPVQAGLAALGPRAALPASIQPFCRNDIFGNCFLPTAAAVGKQYFSSSRSVLYSTYSVYAQVNRALTERSSVFGRFVYLRQSAEGDQVASVTYDRFIFTIGFRYEFEPFHLFRM